MIDNAGLAESNEADRDHISQSIRLHQEMRYVSLFTLVLNGAEARYNETTRQIIANFFDNFGPLLWKHLCIVLTNWSSSSEAIRTRSRQNPPLTEDFRREGILSNLYKDFPSAKNHQIKVYFTNVFEVGEE